MLQQDNLLKLKAKTIVVTLNEPVTHWVLVIIEPDAETEQFLRTMRPRTRFNRAHLIDTQPNSMPPTQSYEPTWNFIALTPKWVDSELKVCTLRLEVARKEIG